MGQGRKCWDVGSVPAEALGALSRRSKNASEELMNAHTKTCGCLCKQGTTAMRKDQRQDAHHKPLALGLEENSVLAASGGVLWGAQGSPWGTEAVNMSHRPHISRLSLRRARGAQQQAEVGCERLAARLSMAGCAGGEERAARWEEGGRLRGRGTVERGDNLLTYPALPKLLADVFLRQSLALCREMAFQPGDLADLWQVVAGCCPWLPTAPTGSHSTRSIPLLPQHPAAHCQAQPRLA